MKNTVLFSALVLLAFTGCQKVISLDVSEAASQVVIEGLVTDSLQPWQVRLSRSVRYDSTNNTPPISGAQVSIRDASAGTTETLTETQAGSGIYRTAAPLAGVANHRYELTVRAEGKEYTAASTLPQRVPFDSLYVEETGGFGGTFRVLYPIFTDPAGVANYYRFVLYRNGIRTNFTVRDDRFSDGRINGRPVFPADQDSIKTGDVITVEMQCLDRPVWQYFQSFGQADGGGSAPANPVSNLQGGALGYFGAVSTQRRGLVAR